MLADKNSQTEANSKRGIYTIWTTETLASSEFSCLRLILAAHELEVQLIRTLLCNRLIRNALSTLKDHVLLRHTFIAIISFQLFPLSCSWGFSCQVEQNSRDALHILQIFHHFTQNLTEKKGNTLKI